MSSLYDKLNRKQLIALLKAKDEDIRNLRNKTLDDYVRDLARDLILDQISARK